MSGMERIPQPKRESPQAEVDQTELIEPKHDIEAPGEHPSKFGKMIRAVTAGIVFLGGTGAAEDADAGKFKDHVRVNIQVQKPTPAQKPYWEMNKTEKARYNAIEQSRTPSANEQQRIEAERRAIAREAQHRAETQYRAFQNSTSEQPQLIETLAVPGGSLQIVISPASAERMRQAGVTYRNGQIKRGVEQIDLTRDITNNPRGQFEIFMGSSSSQQIILTHQGDSYVLDLDLNIIQRPRQ